MDFGSTLTTIVSFLDENEFRYALIGGLALAAYGHARSTLDIDLVVEHDHQARIVDFMESEGFETLHRSQGYSNHRHLDPVVGRVDFVYVGRETATRLFADTSDYETSGGLSIPVPRPEHLAAMKVLAMKNDPERTLREMADIQFLMARPEVDRNEIRRYFEKHGLLERFDELEKSL